MDCRPEALKRGWTQDKTKSLAERTFVDMSIRHGGESGVGIELSSAAKVWDLRVFCCVSMGYESGVEQLSNYSSLIRGKVKLRGNGVWVLGSET